KKWQASFPLARVLLIFALMLLISLFGHWKLMKKGSSTVSAYSAKMKNYFSQNSVSLESINKRIKEITPKINFKKKFNPSELFKNKNLS
ncbi:MAG: hypothetical protein ACPLY7_02145, partial [Microgenomates group bacterium]